MAIPKLKTYLLEQNYNPDNDTDYKAISNDEAYPYVEKSLDLNIFEQLVGVTYRDLMVGRIQGGFSREVDMYSEDGGLTYDKKKTTPVTSDGWKKGKDAIGVRISFDGVTFSDIVPDSYYRINYTYEDRMYTSSGTVTTDVSQAVSKRRSELIQIEFGNMIYSDGVFIQEGQDITKVRMEYSTFTNEVEEDGDLALSRGFIYDGTQSGRIGTFSDNSYGYKPDANGFPLKAEGNIGFKIKVYPCRQKVALMSGADSLWNADYPISSTGAISIENCQNWILTPTDERRPRVFERVSFNGLPLYRELELNTQYSVTNIPGSDGRIDIAIQLSTEYYNIAYGVFVYPKELFIRFNEEIDLIEDLFVPDYLNYDSSDNPSGDKGILTTDVLSYNQVQRNIFRMAITSTTGYEEGRDFLLEVSGSDRTIDLTEVYEDNIMSTVKLYYQGVIFWNAGSTMVDSPFTVSVTGAVITISPKDSSVEPPTNVLVQYKETHEVGTGKDSSGENYWACGFRICCYEKTKTAKEFVSSFRNWVSDHLNNNPDIFFGWQDYEGSSQNPTAISYLQSGYSILYRDGSIVFSEEVTQNTFQDIRNWPPSGVTVTVGTAASAIKKYLQQVYAKFAYYDGIMDVNNGLLREFEVTSGNYRYKLIEDPTYPDADTKRWLIRNDNKMPTTFYYDNSYLPTPNYIETGDCTIWTSFGMKDGEILAMNLSDYRPVSIKEETTPPAASSGNTGDVVEKTFTLAWDPSYIGETEKVTEYTGSAFIVSVSYTKSITEWFKSIGVLKYNGSTVLNQIILKEEDFDSDKTIEENISSRPRYIFETGDSIPFDVVFEAGEEILLVYARRK